MAAQVQAEENRRVRLGAAHAAQHSNHSLYTSTNDNPTLIGRKQNWGTGSAGKKLGGVEDGPPSDADGKELRQRALQAAERRQKEVIGVSAEKAAELSNQQQKSELICKITEQCRRDGIDVPLGLHMATVDQLRRLYRRDYE